MTVQRGDETSAIIGAARLRCFLVEDLPAKASVVSEAGGWAGFLEGLPVSAGGETSDGAVTAPVDALREDVDDWVGHLRLAPDHRDDWPVGQLVRLSEDEQLRYRLTDEAVSWWLAVRGRALRSREAHERSRRL